MIQTKGVFVGASSSGGGAASSIVIGNPVTGGGANRVLYEDGSQNLAADSGFTFASNILTAPTITATTKFIAANGTAGAPTYTFSNSALSGFYSVAASDIGLSVGGTERFRFGSGGRLANTNGYAIGTTVAAPDIVMSRYAAKQLMISGDGTGATTNAGVNIGYAGASGYSAISSSGITPSATGSGVIFSTSGYTSINSGATGVASISRGANDVLKITGANTGEGPIITAGTAVTDVPALSVTRTNNNAAVATGVKFTFTDTTSAAGFKAFQVLGGAAGSTNLLSVSKAGLVDAPAYSVAGSAGASFGPGAVTSITVVNGIVTAIS